jgi:hypothetical protein
MANITTTHQNINGGSKIVKTKSTQRKELDFSSCLPAKEDNIIKMATNATIRKITIHQGELSLVVDVAVAGKIAA